MMSVIIPVYKNSLNIQPLLEALEFLKERLEGSLEAVFVVDGSPDDSHLQLATRLPSAPFPSQLLCLSRNFGSFSAIRAGLEVARGDRFSVMAADLQEPPELIEEFDRLLSSGGCDVAVGERISRDDPALSRLLSRVFWFMYRRYVAPEMPRGGVDIFGCCRQVRDEIVQLRETNSSLVGLLFWVGYRRALVPYARRKRKVGKSAWTFQKKLKYLTDSVFSFSDLPIVILTRTGVLGMLIAFVFAIFVVAAKLDGTIPVPGYAATVLTVVFFGALNCFGLGIIGNYVFRTFENTKQRPNFLVSRHQHFGVEPGCRALGDAHE